VCTAVCRISSTRRAIVSTLEYLTYSTKTTPVISNKIVINSHFDIHWDILLSSFLKLSLNLTFGAKLR
jgi:hypothetical protein